MSETAVNKHGLNKDEKEKASQAFEKEDYKNALDHFQKALETDPDDAQTLCNVGLIYLSQGDFEQAESYLMQSLRKDENIDEAWFNLGCLHQDQAEYEKALSFYKEVIKRKRNDVETFLRMGVCAKSLGRNDDAKFFYEEGFRLNPNSLEAGSAFAGSLLEENNRERAEEVLMTNLVSFPDNIQLNFSIGLIQKDLEKYESALARFNKVVTLDENHAQGFYHLGECCLHLNLLDQAEPFFANAYKLNPSNIDAVYQLGLVYEKLKKSDQAVTVYEEWVRNVESNNNDFEFNIDEFERICNFLSQYWQKNGDAIKASLYKDKTQSQSDSDYSMSLQIDEE